MIEIDGTSSAGPSRWALPAAAVLAGGGMLAHLAGEAWLPALLTAVIEGTLACLVVLAVGGLGSLVLRPILPVSTGPGLRAVTYCGAGLWLLSTAVLAAGSSASGLLVGWVWWPVIIAGAALAVWRVRRRLESFRLPDGFDAWTLAWVLVALAVGIALAGATRPPGWAGAGFLGHGDEYDVMEYHLQVPREYFEAGRISVLRHNVYSYYPLGVEMLFLLAMVLRGGAYEGMYLATMLHGAFGVLAVAGILAALRRDEPSRGRFAAVLLATAPFVVYAGWLAIVELAEACYLALALLWLRQWLRERSIRSALLVGAMSGAACATKYLCVGLVAGPVLAAMAVAAMTRRGRAAAAGHLAAAVLAAAVAFSPWLVRNLVSTGNPVFPLATSVFGRGHWSAESQKRWDDGHGPEKLPPVPQPEGWEMPQVLSRAEMFVGNFLQSPWFTPGAVLLAALGAVLLPILKGRDRAWEAALAGVLAMQVGIWTAWTHEMPPRFLLPALVPMSLLSGGLLARLACLRGWPFRRDEESPAGAAWGRYAAGGVLALAAGMNLLITYGASLKVAIQLPPWHGVPGREITMRQYLREVPGVTLPDDATIMLIGEAKVFYFPSGTVYATAFDSHPLAELLERGRAPAEILADLRKAGVTYLWVNWSEIVRLARTYGYPAVLGDEPYRRWIKMMPPGLEVLRRMEELGLRRIDLVCPATQAATSGPASVPTSAPALEMEDWNEPALYALPE